MTRPLQIRPRAVWPLSYALLSLACGHQAGGNGSGTGTAPAAPAAPSMPAVSADEALPPCARTVPVAGGAALAPAIASAQAGDCLILADGDYAFPVITQKGAAGKPIVIRAQKRLGAVVSSGDIHLDGAAHVLIEGLLFTSSGAIQIKDSEHCRLSRCRINPAEVAERDWVTITGTSRHIRIDRNDFGPKKLVGNMLMVGGKDRQISQHNRIDRNFFHDITYGGGNGWETIRLGLSGLAPSKGFNVIELNLFKGASGDPETISVKSSDAIVRYNTYRATNGEITLRHGNRTQVYGNYLLADGLASARGIRVLGADHKIWGNTFEDIQASPAVLLRGGSHPDTDTNGTEFYRVYRAQVVNNTILRGSGITVGGRGDLPPLDCLVANNLVQGTAQAVVDSGTGTRIQNNINVQNEADRLAARLKTGVGSAEAPDAPGQRRPLTEADVGPNAP